MHSNTFFKIAFGSVLIALLAVNSIAEAPKFKDGDRICFIGDSITHQGGYHTQLLLFYATRFPQMRLETWNRGFAGDSAGGGVKRYPWDIAPLKPTIATIMLGMNDVGRQLYAEGKSGPQVEAQRRKAIDARNANMGKLAALLAKDGTRIVFITPSLYDQTGNQKSEKLFGVNDALKACAEADRKLAAQYHAGLVDFNGPMEAINKAGQAKDPGFTIVGPDRVHPGPVGHLFMTYLFLKEQGVSPIVADMEIDASRNAVLKQGNCEISKLSTTGGVVSFSCLEKALPFPVDLASEKVLKLVPFTKEINQETLKISGLSAGDYEILIDGKLVLKTTAATLKGGVNLATVANTPQYQQALKVRQLIADRAVIEGRKLRVLAQVAHLFFSDLKERSPEIERKVLEEQIAAMRKTEGVWNRYRTGVIEAYFKLLPEKAEFESAFARLSSEISTANKPSAHLYTIRPAR